jgi:hypothetical protein
VYKEAILAWGKPLQHFRQEEKYRAKIASNLPPVRRFSALLSKIPQTGHKKPSVFSIFFEKYGKKRHAF